MAELLSSQMSYTNLTLSFFQWSLGLLTKLDWLLAAFVLLHLLLLMGTAT